MNYSLFRSKTFYTIIAMAVVGAGNAVMPVVSPTVAAILEVILTILASQFHLSTATKFGARN